MAFPTDVLPVDVGIALGADLIADPDTWAYTDITNRSMTREGGITISRGRRDEQAQAEPSSCSLLLNNSDGRFSRLNPAGAYYPDLAKNTPLRVRVASIWDRFSTAATDSWGTSSSGDVWTTTAGGSTNYSVTGGVGRHSHPSVNVPKYSLIGAAALTDTDQKVTFTVPVVATGGNINVYLIARYTDPSNYYTTKMIFTTAGNVDISLFKVVAGSATNLATVSSATTYVAGSTFYARMLVADTTLKGKIWSTSAEEPDWQVTATASNLAAGRVGIRSNPDLANNNTLPLVHTFDNYLCFIPDDIRFVGFVVDWPPRWNPNASHHWVPVRATGVMRRLGQGDRPARSAARRMITAAAPVAYWPCEDDSGATSLAEYHGGPALKILNDVSPGSSGPDGSGSLPVLTSTAGLSGLVPDYDDTHEWTIAALLNMPGQVGHAAVLLRWYTSGTYPMWQFKLTPGTPDTIAVEAYDQYKVRQINDSVNWTNPVTGDEAYDQWVLLIISQTTTSVASYSYGIRTIGDTTGMVTDSAAPSISGGKIRSVLVPPSIDLDGTHIGHIAVWDSDLYLGSGDFTLDLTAFDGYPGETASDRFARLCTEDEIAYSVADDEYSLTMGPQPIAAIVSLLRECETATSGSLEERRTGELALDPHGARENQSPAMALVYTSGHIAQPFEPADDDQLTRNDVTVSRTGGSEGRFEDQDGPLGIDAVGRYATSLSANLEEDDQAYQLAAWTVNLGTVDAYRWPNINLQLQRATTLIPYWRACDIGSRLTIAGLPDNLPPDLVDLVIQGYTERLSHKEWEVALNCSPYRPWRIAVAAADTCKLLVSRDTDDTSFTIASYPAWSVDSTDFPTLVTAGGEDLSVTNCAAGSAATFVATGTVAHASNASVTPSLPAGVAEGDLLLIFAAIRNSGTGTVDTPSGYTSLVSFGNMALFGKYHSGSESNPTVSFTGGVANADTSAQMCAFRNLTMNVVNSRTQLNGSAQDIAAPVFIVRQNNCVVLALGWKQDDWTSVAAASGMTEIGEPDTTTGDDQGLVWDYVIQTTKANFDLAASKFAVTGGGSAISRFAYVALAGDVRTWTVTRSVNGATASHAVGTSFTLDPDVAGVYGL